MNAAHLVSSTTSNFNLSAQRGDTHTVAFGDSLFAIARANNVSVDDLLAANPQIRNPNEIFPGDLIQIPNATNDSGFDPAGPLGPGGNTVGPSESPQVQLPSSVSGVHTVVPGDSLSAIARANDVTVGDLIAANPQISNPNVIFTGDQINIPSLANNSTSDPVNPMGPYDRPGIPVPVNPSGPSFPPPPAIPGITVPGSAISPVPGNANDLLASGNYDNHFTRSTDVDLRASELSANEFNGNDNHIVLQSVFDPVVNHKPTTIDEYSVTAVLPEGVDPRDLLRELAVDMDGALGGEFAELGDFKNQGISSEGELPEVGQIIDIDVLDGLGPFESPFNAPVVISHTDDHSFSVQTIEYNGDEHLLHGTREWGFEKNQDGTVTFYTRGVSVEDNFAAEQGAKDGEFKFWSAWTDGIQRQLQEVGGMTTDTKTLQFSGPTGSELFGELTGNQQREIRDSQIASHEREAERLIAEAERLLDESQGRYVPYAAPLDTVGSTHRDEAEEWRNVAINR